MEEGAPRFLLIDLRRVAGVDSSAVVAFVKAAQLAEANGFELVFTGASDAVRRQLERGGVVDSEGVVRFEPDLDHGLQRCEDGLLEGFAGDHIGGQVTSADEAGEALAGLPPGLAPYLKRVEVPEGFVLIQQDDPPEDVFVLESGRLRVEMVTPEGTRMRLRTIRPGVVVGEIALYTGVPRTADVVAEVPSVVLRLSGASMERMESSEPELAAEVHRWFATTLAERLMETQGVVDALLD